MTAVDRPPDEFASVRQEILTLLERGRRNAEFSRKAPTRWNPFQVLSPETGMPYSDVGAWDLIAELLRAGHPLECIDLDKPIGKKGYVMKFRISVGRPPLYIKLQLGSGSVLGRSFHYSDTEK